MKVFRRYTDFEWLRQTLLHLYSSNIIPPIPKKTKMGKNKFDESYLLKRTRTLERFLNILMEDPILKESQIIFDFLSLEEGIKFEETKKLYQKIKIPQNLTEYKNLIYQNFYLYYYYYSILSSLFIYLYYIIFI